MEVASKFSNFLLPLNEAFVEQAWTQELFEIDDEPYEEGDDSERRLNMLIDTSEALSRCLHSPESLTEFSAHFWSQLRGLGLHQRNLLPYLSYYASTYSRDQTKSKSDIVGLIVASVYLKLLAMPGAVVFDMFHQVVFDYAVEKLNVASKVQQGSRGDKIAEGWKRSVLKKVDVLLDDLTRLIKMGFLKERPLAVNVVVKKLTDLLTLDRNVLIRDFTSDLDKSLTFRVYKALFLLCTERSSTCVVFENLMLSVGLGGTLGQARSQFETVSNFVQQVLRRRTPHVSWQPAAVLLQQLLTRAVERAENRQRLGHLASQLLVKLPPLLRNCVANWALRFLAFSERPTHRLMALEFFQQLLHERQMEDCADDQLLPEEAQIDDEEVDDLEIDDPELQKLLCYPFSGGQTSVKHFHILCLIIFRIDDVAPTIRTKALTILAEVLASPHHNSPLKQILRRLFVDPYTEPVQLTGCMSSVWTNRTDFLNSCQGAEFDLPDAKKIANTLCAIAEDERVFVRRAALLALVNLAKLSNVWLSESLLELLSNHCRDPAVLVRKQIISNMTELLHAHHETNSTMLAFWVVSVMPCLQDPESKAQELVQENLHDLFLGNLSEYSASMVETNLLPWRILRLATANNMKKLFSDTFQLWAKQRKLPSSLVGTVKSFIDTSFNSEAWILLAIFSESQTVPDIEFASQYYKKVTAKLKKSDVTMIYSVLRVLQLNAKSISGEQGKELRTLLCTQIENTQLPSDLIGTAMDTVAALDIATNQTKHFFSWCKTLFKKMEQRISQYVQREASGPESSQDAKLREVTTVADAARLASLNNYLAKLVSVLLSLALAGDEGPSNFTPKQLSFEVTPRLRAASVVSAGKLALLQEQAASESVRVFQHLLRTSPDNILKCNVLTVLADLIGKYATLVDSIVGEIETCLREPEPEMRRHALVVVVQLLQGDFVKLRGTTLLFSLLGTLCDAESDLQEMAACYLTNTLIAKEPNVMQQNLVSALFLLNGHKEHERFSKMQISPAQLKRLSLPGPEHKCNRLTIYNFMLEFMSDDHRFDSLHRLCTQILGGFVDGIFTLRDSEIVLEDALAVLSSDNIRLRCMKVAHEGEATDAEEAFSKLYEHTRKLFVAQEVKNKIAENVVPIVKSLRLMLRRERSRLADDLMRFLRDFMKDFKTEIDEIFAGDKQLVEEIAFDIRQLEEQERGSGQEDEEEDDAGEDD